MGTSVFYRLLALSLIMFVVRPLALSPEAPVRGQAGYAASWGDVPTTARLVGTGPVIATEVVSSTLFAPLIIRSGWQTLVSTDFEGDFPGPWQLQDTSDTDGGEYFWGKSNCRAYQGSYSGWAVGGGAQGSGLPCGSNYPNNTYSMMIFGPFSLEGADAAELTLRLWLNSEAEYDIFWELTSINGVDFFGGGIGGNTLGWVTRRLDLSNALPIGNLLGRPQVWVGLGFSSDYANTHSEGAYVDNIVLRKGIGIGPTTGSEPLPALPQRASEVAPTHIVLAP